MVGRRRARRRHPQRVVVRHQSAWRLPTLIMGLLLLAGGGAALYRLGGQESSQARLEVVQRAERQEAELARLRQALQEKSARNALLERASQVDGRAYSEVREELQRLQAENLELREEVLFYRGIVAPSKGGEGLRVERLDLTRNGEAPLFHYHLMVTQVVKKGSEVRGVVKLRLVGAQGDVPKSLSFDDLVIEGSGNHPFKFRYFQEFEGDIRLPEGFVPRSVEVEVVPSTKGSKGVERSFGWEQLVS